jgi:ATP-binding cassette subfamily F protein 1
MSLRSEAARLQELTLKDEDELEKDDDAANAGDQLTAVYERLQAIGADAAEARGSKILAGLGFSKDMQVSFLFFFCVCYPVSWPLLADFVKAGKFPQV